MPGRSAHPWKGGRSSATAQWDFGGSSPSVRQPSSARGSNAPGRTAPLNRRTVASRASGASPSAAASSRIVPAVTGGNTVGMKRPTGFASTIA